MTTVERFWNKVDIGSREECWPWEARRNRDGYGQFSIGDKDLRAHRYSFFLINGYNPPVVMHTCDNPPCVNPFHLLAGTQALNNADRDKKGRNWQTQKTHCIHGHIFDEANTYINKGRRHCKECINQRNRAKRTTTTTN